MQSESSGVKLTRFEIEGWLELIGTPSVNISHQSDCALPCCLSSQFNPLFWLKEKYYTVSRWEPLFLYRCRPPGAAALAAEKHIFSKQNTGQTPNNTWTRAKVHSVHLNLVRILLRNFSFKTVQVRIHTYVCNAIVNSGQGSRRTGAKGQLISEWNFGVFKSPKKPTKF